MADKRPNLQIVFKYENIYVIYFSTVNILLPLKLIRWEGIIKAEQMIIFC